jgi:hypothetical protein
MVTNMGSVDRLIRFLVGAIILVVGLMARSWWAIAGGVLVVTAFLRFCPAYLPFRFKTIRVKTK